MKEEEEEEREKKRNVKSFFNFNAITMKMIH